MTATPLPPGPARTARTVVLVVLWSNAAWALLLPGWLATQVAGSSTWLAACWAVLVVHGIVHVLLLRSTVTPAVDERTRTLLSGSLVVLTLAAWPLLGGPLEPAVADDQPWAWLAGFTVAALVVTRPVHASAAAVLLGGLLVASAVGWGTPLEEGLVFAAGAVVASGALSLVVVWMLRVVVTVEDGRAAEARLAVVQERLRVARDLHDVLGHRLGVIALRAELAGQEDIQTLARDTLQEVRAAVHDYGTVDLAEQLRSACLVLGSAGVDVEVDEHLDPSAERVPLPPAVSQVLAAAVRESVTNVLRHSDAGRCRVGLQRTGHVVRLVVRDDGSGLPGPVTAGSGLAGLAERARLVGGTVHAERDAEGFRLVVEVPV